MVGLGRFRKGKGRLPDPRLPRKVTDLLWGKGVLPGLHPAPPDVPKGARGGGMGCVVKRESSRSDLVDLHDDWTSVTLALMSSDRRKDRVAVKTPDEDRSRFLPVVARGPGGPEGSGGRRGSQGRLRVRPNESVRFWKDNRPLRVRLPFLLGDSCPKDGSDRRWGKGEGRSLDLYLLLRFDLSE